MPHLTDPGAVAPDPPEAPMPPPTGPVTLTTAMTFGELLGVAHQAESYLASNDGARDGWRQLHAIDPEAACKLLATDVQNRQDAWEQARLNAFRGGRGAPLDPRDVKRIARKYGLHYADAVTVAYAEQELSAVDAEHQPPVSDVPWLDGRRLATPPEPWRTDQYERDHRRATNAGIELDHGTWSLYAEQGQDAVHELLSHRREQAVGRAQAERDDAIALGQQRAADAKAEAERAERAEKGEPEPERRPDALGNVSRARR
jgi:hypothetical protein